MGLKKIKGESMISNIIITVVTSFIFYKLGVRAERKRNRKNIIWKSVRKCRVIIRSDLNTLSDKPFEIFQKELCNSGQKIYIEGTILISEGFKIEGDKLVLLGHSIVKDIMKCNTYGELQNNLNIGFYQNQLRKI